MAVTYSPSSVGVSINGTTSTGSVVVTGVFNAESEALAQVTRYKQQTQNIIRSIESEIREAQSSVDSNQEKINADPNNPKVQLWTNLLNRSKANVEDLQKKLSYNQTNLAEADSVASDISSNFGGQQSALQATNDKKDAGASAGQGVAASKAETEPTPTNTTATPAATPTEPPAATPTATTNDSEGWTKTDSGLIVTDEEAKAIKAGENAEDTEELQQLGGPTEPDESANSKSTAQSQTVTGDDKVSSGKDASVNSGKTRKIEPLPNSLLNYASYTYNLSLHSIDLQHYNDLASGKLPNYVPKHVLIASGGRVDAKFVRDGNFKEDMFFKDFKMESIVGLNAESRGSNALSMNFTIIEPYGVTLLERLFILAQKLKIQNWTEMVFLIQIDFIGWDDKGKVHAPVSEVPSKYFPIKIISIDFTVNQQGAEYKVQAIPYNHQAFGQRLGRATGSYNIVANTVSEFFNAGKIDLKAAEEGERAELEKKYTRELSQYDESGGMQQEDKAKIEAELKNWRATASTNGQSGYAGAFKVWQEKLKREKAKGVVDQVEFDIHPDIAKSEIVAQEYVQATDAKQGTPGDEHDKSKVKEQADYKNVTHSISGGDSVLEVINRIVRQSKYIRDQLADPQAGTDLKAVSSNLKTDGPLNWYRITTKVNIGEYDTIRNTYALKLKYIVRPYTIYQSDFPGAPKGKIPGPVKEYNYIYTGHNVDVLNFDVKFDTGFFTAFTPDTLKYFTTTQAADGNPDGETSKVEDDPSTNKAMLVRRLEPIGNNSATRNSSNNSDPKTVIAESLFEYLVKRGADMITLDLSIVGDPAWLKQDEIFMGGIKDGEIEEAPTNRNWINDKTKSIVLDHGEVYILAKFITPVDWDPVTGLMQTGKDGQMDKTMQSAFTGFYKVLTVSHDFEGGKFTQKLNCIRVLGDQYDSGDVRVIDSSNNTGARETPAAKKAEDNPVSRQVAQVSSAVKAIPGKAGDAVAALASSGGAAVKQAGEFINISGEDPFQSAQAAAENNYIEPINLAEEGFGFPDPEEEQPVQDDDADLLYADVFSGLEEDMAEAVEVSINEYGEDI
jgi:hypothetical protein